MAPVLVSETSGNVRTLTLNRPEARNALSSELLDRLVEALHAAEGDPDVRAVVLTGTDPAFCAGLDLREAGAGGLPSGGVVDPKASVWWVLHGMNTPVVGAVNGPAVTGGLELALQCTFLVASERAVFGDTHARVGLHPGGGLTGLLPQAVGLRRAREMSLTGNFVDAAEAHRQGLVNHVVPHDELLPTALGLAGDIATGDPRTVTALNDSYRAVAALPLGEGLALERERFAGWDYDPAGIEDRRRAILERGRGQLGS
ncbi:MAG TPA: enoyl-CoA hydratase [Acidimicrobiia bacterium]|nr:enoyl-CoA hydratase [Acidimicrobiia bacterium]